MARKKVTSDAITYPSGIEPGRHLNENRKLKDRVTRILGSESLLLADTRLLPYEFAKVEQFRAANPTLLENLDLNNVRVVERENTLYTNTIGHLPYCKRLGCSGTANLKDITAKILDTLLGAFHDLITHNNIVARVNHRE